MSEAFLIGCGKIHQLIGERGETPPCPEAKFKRGDVVKVRRNKAVGHFPAELIVLVAIPPGFSPDDALADLVGKPRPLMKRVGSRKLKYILCREGDATPYCCGERDLLPSGKEPVEIGEVRSELGWRTSPMGCQDSQGGKPRSYDDDVSRRQCASSADEKACAWRQDSEGNWDTDCHNCFVFIDAGPVENGFEFCPYCGGCLQIAGETDS